MTTALALANVVSCRYIRSSLNYVFQKWYKKYFEVGVLIILRKFTVMRVRCHKGAILFLVEKLHFNLDIWFNRFIYIYFGTGDKCKFLHPVANPNPFGATASRSSISFESSATLKSEDGVNWEKEEQTKEQAERSKRQSLIEKSEGKTLFEQLQARKDEAQEAFEAQKRMHFGLCCVRTWLICRAYHTRLTSKSMCTP